MASKKQAPKQVPKKAKPSPKKPKAEPKTEVEHVVPDQVTYPNGEIVVDANGDEHVLPDDMALNEQRALSRFEKQQTAITLRIAGATQEQIARRLGVNISTVVSYLNDAMKELNTESSQLLRTVYGRRLEMLLQKHWPNSLTGDMTALSAVLSIMDRQFRLYGFDKPETMDGVMLDGESEIVVLGKDSTKQEFMQAMQRARAQIQAKGQQT